MYVTAIIPFLALGGTIASCYFRSYCRKSDNISGLAQEAITGQQQQPLQSQSKFIAEFDQKKLFYKAKCYWNGSNDIPKDIQKAINLYKITAQDRGPDQHEAAYELAKLYLTGEAEDGINKDLVLAIKYLEIAVENNIYRVICADHLAQLYDDSDAGLKDVKLAKKYAKILFEHSGTYRIKSALTLGQLYQNDEDQDFHSARHYLEIAANSNHRLNYYAYFPLARLYHSGNGGDKDLVIAKKYYQLSVDNYSPQYEEARRMLNEILMEEVLTNPDASEKELLGAAQMFLEKKDEDQAITCYRRIMAMEGSSKDMVSFVLGNLYRNKQMEAIDKKVNKAEIAALTSEMLKYYQLFVDIKGEYEHAAKSGFCSSITKRDSFSCQFYEEILEQIVTAKRIIAFENLGGHLLVPATNDEELEKLVASADPEISAEIEQMRIQFANKLKAIGYIENDEEIPHRYSEGVCRGMVINIISLLFQTNAPNLKSALTKILINMKNRSGTRATVIQSVYSHLVDILQRPRWTEVYKQVILTECTNKDGNQPSSDELDEMVLLLPRELINRALYGSLGLTYKQSLLRTLADEHRLTLWMEEPDGCYDLSIFTVSDAHALFLAKEKGSVFLYDPNFGLLDCGEDPIGFICKLFKANYGENDHHYMAFARIEATVKVEATKSTE